MIDEDFFAQILCAALVFDLRVRSYFIVGIFSKCQVL